MAIAQAAILVEKASRYRGAMWDWYKYEHQMLGVFAKELMNASATARFCAGRGMDWEIQVKVTMAAE